jgi:hypothetical protein
VRNYAAIWGPMDRFDYPLEGRRLVWTKPRNRAAKLFSRRLGTSARNQSGCRSGTTLVCSLAVRARSAPGVVYSVELCRTRRGSAQRKGSVGSTRSAGL